ncbi:MAG: ArsA-related P-loop ATPase [Myxococcota bacterium]
MTQTVLLAGSGGVGKTATSAALGLSFAERGLRTLVLTVDPARRLSDSLALDADASVPMKTGISNLWVWMPKAEDEFPRLIREMLRNPDPFLENPVTEALLAAPAGVHEIAVALRLGTYADSFDVLVIDTAPHQHALDFLDTPNTVRQLLRRRSLSFLSAFGGLGANIPFHRTIDIAVQRILPLDVIRAGARFFAEIANVGPALVRRAEQAERLIAAARFVLVSDTSEAGVNGAARLDELLRSRGTPPHATILNRMHAPVALPPHDSPLRDELMRHQANAARARKRFPDALALPRVADTSSVPAALAARLQRLSLSLVNPRGERLVS